MSKLSFPNKPVLAVDWDATCVEAVYPLEGNWLPGAKEALRELQKKFKVYIFTCRIAPVEHGQWDKPLNEEKVVREVAYIRQMLDDARLRRVGIWQESFKLPAELYIDDKGLHFQNDWNAVISQVTERTGVRVRSI